MELPGEQVVDGRREELAAGLARVRGRITAACVAAGRNPAGVRLLAVTKNFPARDVALLADLGVLDVAEARDAEAVTKVAEVVSLRPAEVVSLRPAGEVRWHMIGRLQRNKSRSVLRWAVQVQSVDSARLVDVLNRAAQLGGDSGQRRAALGVLVQASLDGDPARGGCPLSQLEALADQVATASWLRLDGVMGLAPRGVDPAAAFAELDAAAQRLRCSHPGAVEVSAGMSGDLEQAIAHGSTCVRVGTALLGPRPLTSR
ncbi:MAG: YggS family pyridoxal phosphate-dependent enzyme [Pseudonocardiaceae bacterium]